MRAGISVDSLGVSQLSMILIDEINQIGDLDEYTDVIVFYHKYDVLLKTPHFAMLQEQEMWGYDVPVMATSLGTAQTLLACPRPSKKFLYLWDLEWIFGVYDINALISVYCHKDMNLIARDKEHVDIITNCWKKPVAVLEDFNHEQFIKIVSG